jgi:hypothetical protein
LSHDAGEILNEPAVKAKYEQLGILSGADQRRPNWRKGGRTEAKLWRSVMAAAGIQPE